MRKLPAKCRCAEVSLNPASTWGILNPAGTWGGWYFGRVFRWFPGGLCMISCWYPGGLLTVSWCILVSPAGLLVVSSDSPGVLLVVSLCSGGPRGGAHHSRHGRRGALSLFGNLEF